MIANTQNRQFLSCKWPQYHFSMLFMKVYINSCSLLMCQMNIYRDSTHTDVNWRPFNVKNDRKWSKIHKIVNSCHVNDHNNTFQRFLWWFISISAVCYFVRWIFIEIALILTSIDIHLMSKMIENTQNWQFLLCKWPQYHFSIVFMMVYINSSSLLECQMNIYRDSTHTDVNWRPFNVENDRKYAKSSNFVMQVATIPLFNGLLDG